MKTSVQLTVAGGLAAALGFGLLSFGGVARAADYYEFEDANPTYFSADLGGVVAPSVKVSSIGGVSLGGVKATLDPGFRFDGVFGYEFSRCASVELDSGLVWNSVDKLGGVIISPSTADLYQVPLLVNLVYRVPTQGRFAAYIGGGAGGIFTTPNVELAGFGELEDTDAAFGYQGFAGVKYILNERSELGLAYKFMGSSNYSWADAGIGLASHGILTHSLMATFTMRF